MTLNGLRKILIDNGVEYYIKEQNGIVVIMHVLVEEEDDAAKR